MPGTQGDGLWVRRVRKRNVGGREGEREGVGRRAWGEKRIKFERQQASQRKEKQDEKVRNEKTEKRSRQIIPQIS